MTYDLCEESKFDEYHDRKFYLEPVDINSHFNYDTMKVNYNNTLDETNKDFKIFLNKTKDLKVFHGTVKDVTPVNKAADTMLAYEICEKGPCMKTIPKGKKFLKIL